MAGIIRTPALSFNNEIRTLSSLNLDKYEVSMYEGLHDLKGEWHLKFYIGLTVNISYH